MRGRGKSMLDDTRMESLFNTIDNKDANGFTEFLTESCNFTFGNMPTVNGREVVHDMVSGFFDSIAGISHTIEQSWTSNDAVICHGVVTYTRHDESELQVPFANIFRMDGSLIRDYRIYVDTSQLYQ